MENKTFTGGLLGYMLRRAWFESMEENRIMVEEKMAKKIIEEGKLQ